VSEEQYLIVLEQEQPAFTNAFEKLYGDESKGKHPKICLVQHQVHVSISNTGRIGVFRVAVRIYQMELMMFALSTSMTRRVLPPGPASVETSTTPETIFHQYDVN
jgi:hypothetical protein